ncbi:MAG TPA: MmcQ/YjbR family DNA-binding protein [Mycobacterium sp.]|nr:MmcQ/YjbR family DNA-binding protein [Mycobacterium sp.]
MPAKAAVDDTAGMGVEQLRQVRQIALALPEVVERRSHGAVCFFVQGRRPLCYYHDDHRGDGRVSLWYPARADVQDEMVTAEPGRFFRPQPSASGTFSTWLGLYLDLPGRDGVDWQEIAAIMYAAYRKVAPQHLIAELDRSLGEGGGDVRLSRPG